MVGILIHSQRHWTHRVDGGIDYIHPTVVINVEILRYLVCGRVFASHEGIYILLYIIYINIYIFNARPCPCFK